MTEQRTIAIAYTAAFLQAIFFSSPILSFSACEPTAEAIFNDNNVCNMYRTKYSLMLFYLFEVYLNLLKSPKIRTERHCLSKRSSISYSKVIFGLELCL